MTLADLSGSYRNGPMRVYDHNLNGAAAAQTGGAQEVHRTDRGGGARTSGGAGGDRVEFSGALGALSRALGADRGDEVRVVGVRDGADRGARAVRVEELAGQYQRDEYHPDAAATARAMTAEALLAAPR